jgi:hypothetical protein
VRPVHACMRVLDTCMCLRSFVGEYALNPSWFAVVEHKLGGVHRHAQQHQMVCASCICQQELSEGSAAAAGVAVPRVDCWAKYWAVDCAFNEYYHQHILKHPEPRPFPSWSWLVQRSGPATLCSASLSMVQPATFKQWSHWHLAVTHGMFRARYLSQPGHFQVTHGMRATSAPSLTTRQSAKTYRSTAVKQ